MATAWLIGLGFLLAGYFVLGGFDYGAQMLTPAVGHDERGRRSLLGALGPFLLGNEVWLVAFAGVLFGAFPFFEGTLLAGLFVPIVLILVGLVIGNTAVQLRSRWTGPAARRTADVLVVVGGALPAVLWGVVIGVLLRGVPLGSSGYFTLTAADLLHPFVLLCGLAAATIFLAHGATFLGLRSTGAVAQRVEALAPRLLAVAAAAVALAVAAGLLFGIAVTNPVTTLGLVAVTLAALLGARQAAARGRGALAFAGTALAAASPVAILGAGQYPYLLVSTLGPEFSMPVGQGAADDTSLALLSGFGLVLLPVIIGYQVWSWWLMRARVDDRTPLYY